MLPYFFAMSFYSNSFQQILLQVRFALKKIQYYFREDGFPMNNQEELIETEYNRAVNL